MSRPTLVLWVQKILPLSRKTAVWDGSRGVWYLYEITYHVHVYKPSQYRLAEICAVCLSTSISQKSRVPTSPFLHDACDHGSVFMMAALQLGYIRDRLCQWHHGDVSLVHQQHHCSVVHELTPLRVVFLVQYDGGRQD